MGGGDGVEDECTEDGADRVGQRSFPDQQAPDLVRGPYVLEQGPHDRGPGDDEDHAHHRGDPERHAEQGRADGADGQEGEGHAEEQQSAHDGPGVAGEVAQVQAESGVVEDHRHGQGDQGGEFLPDQLVGMDDVGEGPRREADRQEEDQRGDAELAA